MALTSEDPDALIKHLVQNGYRIDRRDGKTVWATLPSDKAQAMQAAVRTAEAAALSEAASATTAGAARGAHVRRAQAAMAAARPFQQAAFDQLQALGLASKFEQSHRWVAAGFPVVSQAPMIAAVCTTVSSKCAIGPMQCCTSLLVAVHRSRRKQLQQEQCNAAQ